MQKNKTGKLFGFCCESIAIIKGIKIKERNNARKKGNYKLADIIRKELENKGVVIEDKQDQTLWKYK